MYWVRVVLFAVIAGVGATLLSAWFRGGSFDPVNGIGAGIGTTIGTAVAFAWLLGRTTATMPGVSLADAEAKIAARNILRGYKRQAAGEGIRYVAGSGLFEMSVDLTPAAGELRLDGMRQVVNQLKKGLA